MPRPTAVTPASSSGTARFNFNSERIGPSPAAHQLGYREAVVKGDSKWQLHPCVTITPPTRLLSCFQRFHHRRRERRYHEVLRLHRHEAEAGCQCANLALPTTGASTPLLYTQNGTTTTTTTLTVLTSASYATVTDDISDITLAAGNAFWFTHGADATTSRSVAIEAYVIPGANLQV
jgi:hypothetical protein